LSELAHGLAQQELCGPLLKARPERRGGMADPGELSGAVSVRHVDFRYGADRPLVLDGVSIEARPGRRIDLSPLWGPPQEWTPRPRLPQERPALAPRTRG